jgi:hypothetical protein
MYDFSVLRSAQIPVCLVAGDRDFVCSIAGLRTLYATLPPATAMQIVSGVDHFWWGREEEGATYVADFLDDLSEG